MRLCPWLFFNSDILYCLGYNWDDLGYDWENVKSKTKNLNFKILVFRL